jgi:hypothetical protein
MKKVVFVTLVASGTVLLSSFIMGTAVLAGVQLVMEVERKKTRKITSLGEAIGVISVSPEHLD